MKKLLLIAICFLGLSAFFSCSKTSQWVGTVWESVKSYEYPYYYDSDEPIRITFKNKTEAIFHIPYSDDITVTWSAVDANTIHFSAPNNFPYQEQVVKLVLQSDGTAILHDNLDHGVRMRKVK